MMRGNFRGPSGVWISLPREPKSGFGFVSAGDRRVNPGGNSEHG